MFKQSPSRNHRSKGIKVKHILQLFVLLAICFWLIYQVKHSHDKKKEFDEKNAKILPTMHGSDEILRFGRKDLHPRMEETIVKDAKHEEGEAKEEEEEHEGGGGGGENKNEEEEEQQDEDNKHEEKEDEGRGGGDDEIDENNQDKTEMELEHEENLMDEEKEREEDYEKEAEEGQREKESSLEDHDRDESNRNVHEAREEHYKANNASSAVTHDMETGSDGLEKSNENFKTQLTDQEKVENTKEVSAGQKSTGATMAANEMAENVLPQNVTDTEDSTNSNSTVTTESTDQLKVGSSSNLTEKGTENHNVSLPNGEETISVLTRVQNITDGGEGNNANSMSFTNTQKVEDTRAGESSNSTTTSETSVEENIPKINETNNEKSETRDGTDAEVKGSSKSEIVEEAQEDPIDSSDSSIHLDEHDVRTDLSTLPDIRTEGSNDVEATAE